MDANLPYAERRRVQLRALAEDLDASSHVRATDVVDDPARNTPVLEVTLSPRCDGVTPPVMNIVRKHGATIADVTPRGDPSHPIATLV